MESDTIVAVATPPGEGGVGIVRASGPDAGGLPAALFPSLSPRWHSHHLRHGPVVDPETGLALDQALGCLMRGPHSYTGEDVFEIHCHGNPLLLDQVMAACLASGCRIARPGEFTLRAFLNGRLDLSQAEAVADVVRARSNAGLELALQQLTGRLSQQVEPVRAELVRILARLEAMVDFSEEDVPPRLDTATIQRLEWAHGEIERLLAGAAQGIVLREGASLVIAGSPNVGKSSMLNALLGADRSIVTPIAGTTRDTVEELLQIRGVPFRAIDTAGITDTEDVVERIGVARSRQALEMADVILLVLDRSRPLLIADRQAIAAVQEAQVAACNAGRAPRLVVALNKDDLPPALDTAELERLLGDVPLVSSNTVTPEGLDSVRQALEHAALGGTRRETVLGNRRHQDALQRASHALRSARSALRAGIPLDLASFDVRAAANALGEITGHSADDELLDRIFRDFCIGK